MAWATVPFWDRGREQSVRLKRINYVGYAAMVAMIGLTVLGYAGFPHN
jgi:hypothetical protein